MSNPTKAQKRPKPRALGLKSVDFLGSEFAFKFPSTTTGRHQTHFGGCITILLTIISATTFVLVMSQYFDKTTPVVTTSSEIGPRLMKFNLYEQLMFSPITMYIGTTYIERNWSKYVTVRARVETSVFNLSTKRFEISPYREFDFIPCEQSRDLKVVEFLIGMNNDEGLRTILICPDFGAFGDDLTVIDDFGNLRFRWVNVHIYPCSLPNKQDCASEQEIRALTVDINPVFKMMKTSDYKNPIRNFMVTPRGFLQPKLQF